MKKKRVIKGVVLSTVFVLAIIVSSILTNQGNVDMTADMDAPTLPTISFERDGYEVNPLVGHMSEMNVAMQRDTILPYETNQISMLVQHYEAAVTSMKYEIITLDGNEVLYDETITDVGEEVTLHIGESLPEKEAVLKVTLYLEGDQPVYYYTRIVKEQQFYIKENLNYIMDLHNAIVAKEESAALKKGLESNSSGDNTTLQHVTIHSDLSHVLWGDLNPEVIGEVDFEVNEVNASYVSALLSYQVVCAGDNNEEELYNVKEFFKVCYKNDAYYLLAYDRTMTEVFNAENVVLGSKGIILGMTSEEVPYKVNSEGTVVGFVVERELWCYDAKEDEFSLVFSFADSEKEDKRNLHAEHSVRILSMEDNGNMTFSVSGYMNRGMHEGESGLAIYYFNIEKNSIEEKAFIKSAQSRLVIEEELNKLAYYNAEQDILYVLVQNDLYKINLTEDTNEILVENLEEDRYITSDEGHMIAYQSAGHTNIAEVWNFATDKRQTVTLAEGEIVTPLGFVGEDFVYGISTEENAGQDSSGEAIVTMNKLEICDSEGEIVKTYQESGVYILAVTVEKNMITLKRGVKNNGTYKEITDDYITNNDATGGVISLKSYWTDLKQTQYRLLFESGLDNRKANILKPKHTLYETVLTFDTTSSTLAKGYAVYAYGEQAGVFANAADAIELADELSGVVISPKQNYVWEDGNRVSWYRNFNISRFVTQSGENSLQTCLREVLEYEGANVDVVSEMKSKSVEQILTEYTDGEGVRFKGCSSKDMFYLIDKGTPVIALKDSSSAILLIGYDAKTVTYVEPASGAIKSSSIETVDKMTEDSGYTFIGYVK